MPQHSIFNNGTYPGTQSIGTEDAEILVGNQFALTQDLHDWYCLGARLYVDPSLVASLPTTVTMGVVHSGDLADPPTVSKTIPVGAGGWIQAIWDTPTGMSHVQNPLCIYYTFGVGNQYLTSGSNPPTDIISVTTTLLRIPPATGSPPRSITKKAGFSSVNGGGALFGIDIIAEGPNAPPVVNITSDLIEMRMIDVANLSGNVTDDGAISVYAWTVQSGPSTSPAQFGATNTEDTAFTPDALGTYVIRLTATDNDGAPAFDEITIDVIVPTDLILNLGANRLGVKDVPLSITVNTSGGFGTKGYAWTIIDGPGFGSLINQNQKTVQFTSSTTGIYTLQCNVVDVVDSATGTVMVQVLNGPPPVSAFFRKEGQFWIPQIVEPL